MLFFGKFSWNTCLWLQTYANSAPYVYFEVKVNCWQRWFTVTLPEHLNSTKSQGICLHVPACILKSFFSALKLGPMNQVNVKPCQMLAHGELVQRGRMFVLSQI